MSPRRWRTSIRLPSFCLNLAGANLLSIPCYYYVIRLCRRLRCSVDSAHPEQQQEEEEMPAEGKKTRRSTQLFSRHTTFFVVTAAALFLLLELTFLFHRRRSTDYAELLLLATTARTSKPPSASASSFRSSTCPLTNGRFFVYDLPPRFNTDLLPDPNDTTGFGPSAAADLAGTIPELFLPSWSSTDQFASEIIFHRRALSHPCRTTDPDAATAFYFPFYPGLAVVRHLWSSAKTNSVSDESDARDAECAAALRWLESQPSFRRLGGRDHFMAIGRTTFDFRRSTGLGGWGSDFLNMPGIQNVTRLVVERHPWEDIEVGIPFPTGYHPRSAAELSAWQRFVLTRPRPTLFGFAGGARTDIEDDFRAVLFRHCAAVPSWCRPLDCGGGACEVNRTGGPLGLFLSSRFCLQPRGDTFVRKSFFDCIVAGAVPVTFWRRSTWSQYGLYLPDEEDEGRRSAKRWSVFIDRKKVRSGEASVADILAAIPERTVRKMRERLVEKIPRIVYADDGEFVAGGRRDAADVAFDSVLSRFMRDRV